MASRVSFFQILRSSRCCKAIPHSKPAASMKLKGMLNRLRIFHDSSRVTRSSP
ncbi:Uncharacterised protein [Mycobacteroides abscessus subsp. abscessus]|nr:Uncharacterised protein [Mycobacteroides abscessus subsp. abscessus]